MNDTLVHEDIQEKLLPFATLIAPMIAQGVLSALRNHGGKKAGEFDFVAPEFDAPNPFASNLADTDEAPEEEAASKIFGAIGTLISTLGPKVAEEIVPIAIDGLNNLMSGGRSGRRSARKPSRRSLPTARIGSHKGYEDEDPDAKAWRIALQLMTPFFQGKVRANGR